MKKFVMAGLAVLACIVGVTGTVFSQGAINSDIAAIKFINENVKSHLVGYAAISPKAMRDFRKNFTNVNDEVWVKSKNGYLALFTKDDIRVKVEYDNKGNWYATQKSYVGQKLQSDILDKIKRVYSNYTINWITELAMPYDFTGTAYIIQMENERSCKTISLYEGEMKTMEEFSKPAN